MHRVNVRLERYSMQQYEIENDRTAVYGTICHLLLGFRIHEQKRSGTKMIESLNFFFFFFWFSLYEKY